MAEQVLICGTNWLGDSVMSMPALQAYRRKHPETEVVLMAKSKLVDLWSLHSSVNEILELKGGLTGTFDAAGVIRDRAIGTAYIFPNSFRSAFIPFFGGVRERIGMRGHQRALMLTRIVGGPAGGKHQAWEYMDILGLEGEGELDAPRLTIPPAVADGVRRLLEGRKAETWIGILPGAAYGPAKRWPAGRFAAVGQTLATSRGCGFMVLGSNAEKEIGAQVAGEIGAPAVNLAGRTTLKELAALLAMCRVVVSNDSGGMHLAAAVGTPVVAIFGITDPAKTGPLGPGHRVISDETARHSRDIERDSVEARKSLEAITPDRVCRAVMEILRQPRAHTDGKGS